jgi:sirohydrochlorin cobaltochelatase
MSSVLTQDSHSTYEAYFLVTHGSKSPHSWTALQTLITHTQTLTEVCVGGGCLEGQAISLAQQLQQFCETLSQQSQQSNLKQINVAVIPLFLLPGVHAREDIPAEIAIAQQKIANSLDCQISLKLTPHLGTHPQIPSLLQSQLNSLIDHSNPVNNQNIGFILLSHGSRLLETFQTIEALADQLGAIAAYWSVPPSLNTQIEQLIAQGKERITIMPYFLSSGGIMDAIAQQISLYSDSLTDASRRAQINIAPTPFSPEQIARLALDLTSTN